MLSTRLELVWIENRHANDISTQFKTVAPFSRVTWHLQRFFSNSLPPPTQWTPQQTILFGHIPLPLALSTRCLFSGRIRTQRLDASLRFGRLFRLTLATSRTVKQWLLFFSCRILSLTSPLLLLLAIWPQRWLRLSLCQPIQRNVKRSVSLNQFGTLSSISVIFRELDSSIPPGRQLRSRIIAQRTLRLSPLSLDFSLRLPQSIMSTASARTPISRINTPPSTPAPKITQPLASSSASSFAFDNATDDVLALMNATQLRQFIFDARPSS